MKKHQKSVMRPQKKQRNKTYAQPQYVAEAVDNTFYIIEDEDEAQECELITTVKCKELKPLPEEATMDHKQRYAQDMKKLAIRLQEAIKNKEIEGLPGYTANRVFVDAKGRVTVKALPVYYKPVLTQCKHLLTSPTMLPALMVYDAMNNCRTRGVMSRVLTILLTSAEFEGGRIGILSKNVGISPISHRHLMREYLLRFGVLIDEKTWYNAVERLVVSGYLYTTHVKASIEVKNEAQEIQRIVRSSASYKQFSPKFFDEFKVTFFQNVATWIREAIKSYKNVGYLFKWKEYTVLAGEIRARVEARSLNELIQSLPPISASATPDCPY